MKTATQRPSEKSSSQPARKSTTDLNHPDALKYVYLFNQLEEVEKKSVAIGRKCALCWVVRVQAWPI